jgi:2-methylcitrate dehydratase PrpD
MPPPPDTDVALNRAAHCTSGHGSGNATGDVAPATLSAVLAAHVAGLQLAAIPAPTLARARLFLHDTLAVAWAGSDAPGCGEVHAMFAADAQAGIPPLSAALAPDIARAATATATGATVWAYGTRLPAADAAFVNATLASALDYDSLGRDAPVHVNIVVLPVALALAQATRASGADLLCALVAGCDLMCRIGASFTPPHRGFAYTSVVGALGAAAAAARVLRLDATATRHALGLAFLQAGGTQQANIEPTLAKRLLASFPARAGILAARLAQQGLTAPAQIFEGECGLYALYQPGDPARLTDALGVRFDSDALSIKAYPSCGCNHTAIAGMIELANRHDLQPDDVESIAVTVSPYIDRIVGAAYDPSEDPQVAAQFSIRYSLACALVRRRLGLAEIEAQAARDPLLLREVAKVQVVVDPAYTGTRGPVHLRLISRRHGALALRVEHVPGSDEAPLSPAAISAKFAECFARGVRPLNADQQHTLAQRIAALEQLADIASLLPEPT